jgi:hypothetical protein
MALPDAADRWFCSAICIDMETAADRYITCAPLKGVTPEALIDHLEVSRDVKVRYLVRLPRFDYAGENTYGDN